MRVTMKIDPTLLRNFDQNIRKAQALARAHEYLEDLLERGGNKTLGVFMKMYKEIMKSLGGEDIEQIVKREIEARIGKRNQGQAISQSQDLVKLLRKEARKLEGLFEDMGLLINEVLLEQAVVTAVTAFEVYFRDTAIYIISNSREVHERFYQELKEIKYDALRDLNFDLKRTLGTQAVRDFDFYSPDSIRSLYRRMFPEMELMAEGNTRRELADFIELRHIIVHNASIVDEKFKRNTRYRGQIGSHVNLKRKQILNSVMLIQVTIRNIHDEIESALAES